MSDITELYIGKRLKPIRTTNLIELQEWCRDYNRRNKFPCDVKTRFAIGFYQIHQGMSWKDNGENKYESYAAAVLHFMMVGEALELKLESNLPTNILNECKWTIESIGCTLLRLLSASQQQIIYGAKSNKTKRASRYNPNKLSNSLGIVCAYLVGLMPKEFREECFYLASKMMTEELK
jgi:hypothetical protein